MVKVEKFFRGLIKEGLVIGGRSYKVEKKGIEWNTYTICSVYLDTEKFEGCGVAVYKILLGGRKCYKVFVEDKVIGYYGSQREAVKVIKRHIAPIVVEVKEKIEKEGTEKLEGKRLMEVWGGF